MSTSNLYWQDVPPTGRMLRPNEVVKCTSLSRSQIYAMIAAGTFPPFLKLSERASAIPESWLNAFFVVRAEKVIAASQINSDVEGAPDERPG
jgi:predicted DNA-binding transcriptional regulator AlpA